MTILPEKPTLIEPAGGFRTRIRPCRTSIAGTFVGHHLGSRISFFVDEDASRIGSQHLGIPILAPDDMRPDASLLIPLMPEIAVPIAERIGSSYGRCILPPPWPRTDPDV